MPKKPTPTREQLAAELADVQTTLDELRMRLIRADSLGPCQADLVGGIEAVRKRLVVFRLDVIRGARAERPAPAMKTSGSKRIRAKASTDPVAASFVQRVRNGLPK